MTEELKRLWAEGYSAQEIAETIGAVSRNAVIGKAHRLGLERRAMGGGRPKRKLGHKRSRRPGPTRRLGAMLAKRPRPQPRPQPQPPPPPPPPLLPANPGEPRMRKLSLLALRDRYCRWPLGALHERAALFCAADAVEGRPYCAFHLEKAVVRPRAGPNKGVSYGSPWQRE
jgi:GcrA cell cycle regulator